jgi:predicted RNase H-like HicB family nuclease
MRFPCNIAQQRDGSWRASHHSPDVGEVHAAGTSKEQALDKLRGEIRYRLELCPCTGESYQHIDLEIIEAAS